MEHIGAVLSRALKTATPGHTTPAEGRNTPTTFAVNKPLVWQTHNDPVLLEMLEAAERLRNDICVASTPRWLSFVGNSGTGKTFLAEQLYQWAKTRRELMQHESLICPVLKRFWPKLLKNLRDGQFWLLDDLSEANFLFLDELVIEHDPTGFAKDKLAELLSRRCGRWTVITANLDMTTIHTIDGRIASRMIRGGSEVIEANTVDYAMR